MNWQANLSPKLLRKRADILLSIRQFFQNKQIVEVDTPSLSLAANTEPAIESFTCQSAAHKESYYLNTSPEFAMKRLLASGSGDIYQMSKVFRAEEKGRWHNPEFTMLEWYRLGMSYTQLYAECVDLIKTVSSPYTEIANTHYRSYASLFINSCGIDPHSCEQAELIECIYAHNIDVSFDLAAASRDVCLFIILTHIIEPEFEAQCLTVVYDYPLSQSALAKISMRSIDNDQYAVAERFEVYWGSVELANGFQELTNSEEQLERFEKDLLVRKERGQIMLPIDNHLIDCLASGMPECSGLALGVDRLVALVLGLDNISDVINFDFENC